MMPLRRRLAPDRSIPHLHNQGPLDRAQIARAGALGLHLPGGHRALMETSPGRYIPAAQDPTDPRTWQVPVVFT
jgi:hypothetical protein